MGEDAAISVSEQGPPSAWLAEKQVPVSDLHLNQWRGKLILLKHMYSERVSGRGKMLWDRQGVRTLRGSRFEWMRNEGAGSHRWNTDETQIVASRGGGVSDLKNEGEWGR